MSGDINVGASTSGCSGGGDEQGQPPKQDPQSPPPGCCSSDCATGSRLFNLCILQLLAMSAELQQLLTETADTERTQEVLEVIYKMMTDFYLLNKKIESKKPKGKKLHQDESARTRPAASWVRANIAAGAFGEMLDRSLSSRGVNPTAPDFVPSHDRPPLEVEHSSTVDASTQTFSARSRTRGREGHHHRRSTNYDPDYENCVRPMMHDFSGGRNFYYFCDYERAARNAEQLNLYHTPPFQTYSSYYTGVPFQLPPTYLTPPLTQTNLLRRSEASGARPRYPSDLPPQNTEQQEESPRNEGEDPQQIQGAEESTTQTPRDEEVSPVEEPEQDTMSMLQKCLAEFPSTLESQPSETFHSLPETEAQGPSDIIDMELNTLSPISDDPRPPANTPLSVQQNVAEDERAGEPEGAWGGAYSQRGDEESGWRLVTRPRYSSRLRPREGSYNEREPRRNGRDRTRSNPSLDADRSLTNVPKITNPNSFKDGKLSLNSTLDESHLSQSEETSPELGLLEDSDSIDPNEMYSTYMKYLNNVKEEEVLSDTSLSESVLHPEILNCIEDKTADESRRPASLEQMTYFVNSDPVRALAFKRKLEGRIRRQEDVKKKNDEKQQQAHEKRLQFLHDKTAKIRGFVQKVEEVKAAQHRLAIQRKNKLDLKLKKAEEKRKMHLNIIKRKAHDEEEKLKEIAFINELEAQNRRHDSLALRQEQEERLQGLVEERQRRLEEKAAKEAAVEERRRALEAERQEKLELMKERRRRKEEFIDRKQQEKEQERLEIAREKAREREERLMARHTAQQATLEELQKKIQQKQEESARRHVESIELIRQKAIEIGIHRNTDNTVPKFLNLYKPDMKGNNAHDKYKLYLKKRLKKIKSRMILRGTNYIKSTEDSKRELTTKEAILEKILGKVKKYEPDKVYLWTAEDTDHLDHLLDEILLLLQEEPSLKTALKDMKAFLFFDSVINSFNYANHDKVSVSSLRCILKIITVCDLSCLESVEVCLYFLLSNVLATLLDSLRFSLQALETPRKTWDLIVEILLRFHALVLDELNELPETLLLTIPDFATRMKDLISYILCSGLVNRLIDLFRPSITEEKFIYGSLIVPSILFFKRLLSVWFLSDELMDVLKSTELLGTVPLLYEGLMKHMTGNAPLPEYCLPIISLYLKLADLDLKLFQDILGAENIALQWRGIASGLMTQCVSQNNSSELLNSVIKLVGYFAVHNLNNQTLLQSGKQPTVLQQLVKLPFKYFCDPNYIQVLFPTLISCSFNNPTNRAIVESEVDYNGLEKFMHSERGQRNNIIRLVLSKENTTPQTPETESQPTESNEKNIHTPD